jgi:hypothetical protein
MEFYSNKMLHYPPLLQTADMRSATTDSRIGAADSASVDRPFAVQRHLPIYILYVWKGAETDAFVAGENSNAEPRHACSPAFLEVRGIVVCMSIGRVICWRP